jgi:hypothetical protein
MPYVNVYKGTVLADTAIVGHEELCILGYLARRYTLYHNIGSDAYHMGGFLGSAYLFVVLRGTVA